MSLRFPANPSKKAALLAAACAAAFVLSHATPVAAQSTALTRGSEQISVGALSILAAPAASVSGPGPAGSVALAAMGSVFVVSGIVTSAATGVEVILDAAGDLGKVSVKIGKASVETLGLSVGTTVNAVAQSTGTLLVASGKVLAFIPNAVGESLLYHSRVPGGEAS